MISSNFLRILNLALILAFSVVVLGAYVRLSDAGLGCPDWPGCYGHLTVTQAEKAGPEAQAMYPDRPLAAHKAWKEMAHRYAAGGLVLLLLALAVVAIRSQAPLAPALPILLLALIAFQAMLGMWTVTLKLKPLIVMGHLLGGFTTLALLWWWRLTAGVAAGSSRRRLADTGAAGVRLLATLALLALIAQIALGGWTSSNYAALACPDFPTCQGSWWPNPDFREGFVMWRGIGPNYEFGVLESPARAAIHLAHRFGAIVAFVLLGIAGSMAHRYARQHGRRGLLIASRAMLGLLLLQVALGISNVVFHLPLPVAVMHNGGAALLLLATLAVLHRLRGQTA